jgi:murein DD-endopeptidase MepM/ murein hydrolase activator NlpD
VAQTALPASTFAAPGVAPVENRNPEQIERLGNTLEQAGGLAFRTGQTIGDRVAGQIDDANTKAAETKFLQSAQSILNDPSSGYFRQQGKAALDQYQPTNEALVKAGNDAQAGLTNELQKFQFKQLLQHHLLSFGSQMADYNHSQSVNYSAKESGARADSYRMLALGAADSRYQTDAEGNAAGDFAKNTAVMEAETLKVAALSGFDPQSEQAKAMLREQYTQLNTAMIGRMLDNHDAAGAKKWYDEQLAKGNIDIRGAESLGHAVQGEYDKQTVEDFVDKTVIPSSLSGGKAPTTLALPVPGGSINVTSGLGMPRANGRSHDGIDIAVPTGTNVLAPADGKVLKVWNDDKFGGGLSMEIQMPNGYVAGFAHLQAANARPGDTVQQGMMVGLSGKSGNATGPVLHYVLKDADGKYVDPRNVSQPQPNKEGIADPNALERGLQMISDSDYSPSMKKQMSAYLEAQHGHYRAIENQKYDDVLQSARDSFFSSGGNYNAIPGSVRMQLKPEDSFRFQKGLPKEDNVDVQAQFILNPKNQTVDWVNAHRMDFTDSTYLNYLGHAQSVANSSSKELGASLDNAQMDDILYKNGFPNLVSPKGDDDKATAVALKTQILNQYTSEQNRTGHELTRDQKGQIIRQTIGDKVSIHRSILPDKDSVSAFNLTGDQAQNAYVTVGNQRVKLASIPADDQLQITSALRSKGIPITQQNIASFWVEGQKRRGKTVPTF